MDFDPRAIIGGLILSVFAFLVFAIYMAGREGKAMTVFCQSQGMTYKYVRNGGTVCVDSQGYMRDMNAAYANWRREGMGDGA